MHAYRSPILRALKRKPPDVPLNFQIVRNCVLFAEIANTAVSSALTMMTANCLKLSCL